MQHYGGKCVVISTLVVALGASSVVGDSCSAELADKDLVLVQRHASQLKGDASNGIDEITEELGTPAPASCTTRASCYNLKQLPASCDSSVFPAGASLCLNGQTLEVESSFDSVGGATVNLVSPADAKCNSGDAITIGACQRQEDCSSTFSETLKGSKIQVSDQGRVATSTNLGHSWNTVYGAETIASGTKEWRVEVLTLANHASNYWEMVIGVAHDTSNTNTWLSQSGKGFGYIQENGDKTTPRRRSDHVKYAPKYVAGDVITVSLDMQLRTLSFAKNGVSQGVSHDLPAGTYRLAISIGDSGDSVKLLCGKADAPTEATAPASCQCMKCGGVGQGDWPSGTCAAGASSAGQACKNNAASSGCYSSLDDYACNCPGTVGDALQTASAAPAVPAAPAAPTRGCKPWCPKNTKSWDVKCHMQSCFGCTDCADYAYTVCEPWCEKDSRTWADKCELASVCIGCSQCSK